MSKKTYNLSQAFIDNGYAIYLPAISGFYTKQLNSIRKTPDFYTDDRIPDGLENGLDGLDFLKEDVAYYYYQFGLYSAGHAQLDLEKAKDEECMVHQRDRSKSLILGDSGGYQIGKGVIKMDWSNAKDPDDPERTGMCQKILEWLEHTADWSMTLDFPAWMATDPKLSLKTGMKNFDDTLDITLLNLDHFMKNRTPGKTKFLNVISGTSTYTGKKWYEAVKKYSDPKEVEKMGYDVGTTLEGYAFAGIHTNNMSLALERILDLIRDGLLEDKDWIHVLGLGRLDWGCFLTSIQRELRKHYNPNLTISFDAASPFVATAYGQCYDYNHFTNKKFTYSMNSALDQKNLEGNDMPMPFRGPIMERLTLGDICPLSKAHAIVEGQHRFDVSKEDCDALIEHGCDAEWVEDRTNKLGKVPRTSWDTLTYLLYMSHNVYKHIEAVQEANRIVDMEYERTLPNWRDWIKDKKSSNANEISIHVPHTLLYFRSFVEELLDPSTPDPYALLEENRAFLDSISFNGAKENVFDSLFEHETVDNPVDKYADINDEKLAELEKGNE